MWSPGSLVALAFCIVLPAPAFGGDPPEGGVAPLVERVDILNNQFVQKETLLFYVSTKAGETYDERRLKDDFRRLWNTGFLDDLVLEAVDGPKGKIVRFRVNESPRIQIVDFRGSKELTTSTIEDELKKREAQLKIDTFYDPAKARKVEAILKAMLAEKGRPFATVKHDSKRVGGAGTQVSFIIDDGPKARVKEIVFDGNHVYPDAKLRGQMKKIKEAGFLNLSWLGGKSTYTEGKWLGGPDDPRGDQGRLEDFYLNNGYVTARVGQPKVSYTDGKSGTFKKKPVKWMRLEVPVTEGDQFRVGELKFEGLTVLKEDYVRPLFKLQTGDVYDESRLKKGFDKLRDVYGSVGYFQWTGGPKKKPDPDRKVVDVTLAMEEDKRYHVGRITFTGNQTTRDKVIRREVYMNEGDVFNTEALKLSIRRINQLGYFKPMEGAPELQPSKKQDDLIDITFKVEEQNRNQFTFGGGISGIDGPFLNASFQTGNFLGSGDNVSLSAQTGTRSRNYQIALTTPYFLDRPITAGINLYSRLVTYLTAGSFAGFIEGNAGIALTSGLPAGRFSRVFASYTYEVIDIFKLSQSTLTSLGYFGATATTTTTTNPTTGDVSLPAGLEPGRTYESRVTPSWVRNTVDNPMAARRGTKYTASFQFVGGPLGGTINYFRPDIETIFYQPVGKKTALGLRADYSFIQAFGSTQQVPYYQRFFMGGENQIRGYEIRAIGPIDRTTGRALGGNKSVLFNAEYYFDVFGPVRFLLFFDAGDAYLEGQPVNLRKLWTSTGAELRFVMPVLNVPFRLIYAWNANRDPLQPPTIFKFAVGTTF